MCVICGHAYPHLSRRSLVTGAGALLAASAVPHTRLLAAEPSKDDALNAITPDAALQRLMEGNARYAANTHAREIFPPAAPRVWQRNFPSRRS